MTTKKIDKGGDNGKQDLLAKVAADIEKTGFPLELRVGTLLRSRNYHVAHNVYFLDRDEGRGREIDMRALYNHFFEIDGEPCAVRHCLIVECKKSSKRPWVFFTSPTVSYDGDIHNFLSDGISEAWPALIGERVYEKLASSHPWVSSPLRGRSFYEAFSEGGRESNAAIHQGLLATIKGAIDVREAHFAGAYPETRNGVFYLPMVILEGELFGAQLTPKGMEVGAIDEVAVSVHYTSSQYKHDLHERHTVLVVRERALTSVLARLEGWLTRTCAEGFKKHPACFETPQKAVQEVEQEKPSRNDP